MRSIPAQIKSYAPGFALALVIALLANGINHPSREMAWMFAYSLLETMMR